MSETWQANVTAETWECADAPGVVWQVVVGSDGGGGAVDSVNGKTGVVVLDAADVGALPDDTPIPDVSEFVTEEELAAAAGVVIPAFVDTTVTRAPAVVIAGPGVTVTLPDAASVSAGSPQRDATVTVLTTTAGSATVVCASGDVFDFAGTTSRAVAAGTSVTVVPFDATATPAPVEWMWLPVGWSQAQIEAMIAADAGPVASGVHDVVTGGAEPEPERAFRFDPDAESVWKSSDVPALTGDVELRARIRVRRVAANHFSEILTRTFDGGVGAIDSPEFAIYESDGAGGRVAGALYAFYEWVPDGGTVESEDRGYGRVDIEGLWCTVRATHDVSTGKVRQFVAVRDASQATETTGDGQRWRLVGENNGGDTGIEWSADPWGLGFRFSGEIEWGQIFDGIDGTLIASPNAEDCTPGDQSFVDGQGNSWSTVAGECVASTETRLTALEDAPSGGGSESWIVEVNPLLGWHRSDGAGVTVSRVADTSQFGGGVLSFGGGAVGGGVEWDVGLDAGTWDLTVLSRRSGTYGTMTVKLDGETVATVDQWQSDGTARNIATVATGIVVGEAGKVTLRAEIATPISDSSTTCNLSGIQLRRTA